MSSARQRLITGLLLSLLLHGVLLWQGLAPDLARPGAEQAEAPRLQLVWVQTPVQAPSPPTAVARSERASAPKPVQRPERTAVAQPSRQTAATATVTEAPAEPPESTMPAPADMAADTARSARAMGRLLDSAAGRLAVQAAARQGPAALQPPVQREDPLASAMREAAHGDCMKGEFKGGGMGLLSLPMLAAAALKGECSR